MLWRSTPRLVGHERRDHVDELREAGDPHAIRIAEQRVDEAADEQRVLEVVDLLEQVRRGGAAAVGRTAPPRARYQTFHSSNDSHSRLLDFCSPCT